MSKEICPMCSAVLKHTIGSYIDNEGNEHTYDGVICPNLCDLINYYT